MMPTPDDPRAEATAVLPPGHQARTLEPSPPARLEPPWYADDPTDPDGGSPMIVTPIPGEGTTWSAMAATDAAVASFASAHWLDGHRRLERLPVGYDIGRRALHQVAFYAVAPKRFAANGRLGLRYTHGGFGTPYFAGPSGEDEQVRVEADRLIHRSGSQERSQRLTTLGEAAEFLGIPYREVWFDGFHDPPPPVGPHAPLGVDPAVTDAVAAWFGFATHVLERARRTPGAEEVSRVQLWPEHFDPAFEMGSTETGRRASYGASAGDDAHPEPYVYVAAWGDIDRTDPFWNDAAFNGASLAHRDLLTSADPYGMALEFLAEGYLRLAG
jgi:hypothetical protein